MKNMYDDINRSFFGKTLSNQIMSPKNANFYLGSFQKQIRLNFLEKLILYKKNKPKKICGHLFLA